MKSSVALIIELAGMALMVYGGWLLAKWLGIMMLGIALVILAQTVDRAP